MKRYDMIGDWGDVEMIEFEDGDYALWDEAAKELAHCEALLIDCQKAHDVTIAGQDALFAENMRVREQVAELKANTGAARLSVRWFAEQMEAKLREHDDRGGWNGCKDDWLLQRLGEEVLELGREINSPFYFNTKHVIRECADVANFAMMIADNAKRGE